MSQLPAELKYAASHEWARLDGDVVTVGITDHAQDALGDLVYVELPNVGDAVSAGQEAGVVESVKAASDIYAPVSGEIIAINDALVDAPEIVNTEPYAGGWLYQIKISDAAELGELLSAEEYAAKQDH
ncbi:glycine cleavage system H protein [Paraperlucidibaca baekdonensis]|uniref:Glycine cleavage system H protein n=1 Tax=Paraperlucidibaca baekdonensis TaxID=748120 RepID=A0A3E0H8D0_9GAMM|nr:glycine cleavage system protein GcvH [Paraperlucidibaca baekdonensis]REH39988.1 glycine cleavage system H protein [Paraperlucidibaca baekdonensis]